MVCNPLAWRLALACCLLGAAVATALAVEPPTSLEGAVQDRDGTIWALKRSQLDRLLHFDGRTWTEQLAPFQNSDDASMINFTAAGDGASACLWRLGEKRIAVSLQTNAGARLLGTCPSDLANRYAPANLLADSQNRVWITGDFPTIYRADEAGGLRLLHAISPEELDDPKLAAQGFNGVQTVEDGLGSVWAWSASGASNYASLRTALVFDAATGQVHHWQPDLPKNPRIDAMARADSRHLWVILDRGGLYRLDVVTLGLEKILGPATPFYPQELFVDGQDLYVVARGEGFEDALWRLREGQWGELVPTLDRFFFRSSPRSGLAVPGGFLIAAVPGDVWFVPKVGDATRCDWRTGFPFEDPRMLARLADGTFFILGRNERWFHGPLLLPPRRRDDGRIKELDVAQSWILDRRGHPWVVLRNFPDRLNEWDGEQWLSRAIPAAPGEHRVAGNWPPNCLDDAEGRIWLLSQSGVKIFDPGSGQWQVVQDLAEAYLAVRARPPHFVTDDFTWSDPQYSADGRRAAYREGVDRLHFYDGSAWHLTNGAAIRGQPGSDDVVGPPWFDAQGRLCTNLRSRTTFQMDAEGKWTEIPFQSHYPNDIWSEEGSHPPQDTPPDGAITATPDACVRDNLGTYWLTWKGDLYKAVPGRCVKVFAADEVQPFRSGRGLSKAFADPHGNAFLLTSSGFTSGFLLKPHGVPPHTTVEVEPLAADAFRVHLNAHASSPVLFHWQLDDGAWQEAEANTLLLNDLPAGPHRLVVKAQDAEVQADATPAVAAFQVTIDPEVQIAGLLGRLADPDYERRKSAVDALALQPARARAALEAARGGASDDLRWWIDCALQRIDPARVSD